MGRSIVSEYRKKIDFELTGELAIHLKNMIRRGLASSKPEIVRRALLYYFDYLDTQDLQRARLQSLVNNTGGALYG